MIKKWIIAIVLLMAVLMGVVMPLLGNGRIKGVSMNSEDLRTAFEDDLCYLMAVTQTHTQMEPLDIAMLLNNRDEMARLVTENVLLNGKANFERISIDEILPYMQDARTGYEKNRLALSAYFQARLDERGSEVALYVCDFYALLYQ